MAYSVEMPELGESVTEGTVTQWLKKVGDKVEVDEPLLEASTDKVDTEIPSPVAGVILEILAEEDDTVDVGAVIARIGEEGEEAVHEPAAGDSAQNAPVEEPAAGSAEQAQQPSSVPAQPAASDSSTEASTPIVTSSASAPTHIVTSSAEAEDVTMPELGESVTEGTITQWLKQPGDTVEVDEPLLEVSTDKVDTEIPSPVAGTLVEVLAKEDDTVDVGAVIARIGSADAAAQPAADASSTPAQQIDQEKPAQATAEPTQPAAQTVQPQQDATAPASPAATAQTPASATGVSPAPAAKETASTALPYVTPLVRKIAAQHGVDLATVVGTGVGGRIRKQDVLAAAEGHTAAGGSASTSESTPAPAASPASTFKVDPEKAALRGTTQRVNRIRELTAKKTLESLRTSAQLTQVHEVDMTHIAQLRAESKQRFLDTHGVKLTYLPFFAKAIVEALVAHPNVNASYNAEKKEMTYHAEVNLGIAVDTKAGLLSPVIHNAQDMSLPELAKAIVDIAERARNNKLKPNDLSGGTFTITNIGSEGALTDTPILVPPQAAMVGTGAIVQRPVVLTEDGAAAIAIRHMVYLPMTYDHQVIDGADAGRFLSTVRDRLETADFEADLQL